MGFSGSSTGRQSTPRMTQESSDQSSVSVSNSGSEIHSDKLSIINSNEFYQNLLESLKTKLEAGCGETLHQIGNAGGETIMLMVFDRSTHHRIIDLHEQMQLPA